MLEVMPAAEAHRMALEIPALALGCDPSGQRLALALFSYLFNSSGWINSSGWPITMQGTNPFAMILHMATLPLETGVCTSASQNELSQTQDAPAVTLPDHCCWYGIRCCTPQTCVDNPFCNCTTGLVISMLLNGNKVRMRESEGYGGFEYFMGFK